MSASLPVAFSQGSTIESFPVCFRGKRFEVLIRASVQGRVGGANDSTEMQEGLFIDAVILEKLRVVTEISEKPVEFPERPLRAVQPTRKGPSCEGFRFQNKELKFDKRLLRMPAVACAVHANKKQTDDLAFNSVLIQIKAGNLSLHDFASAGRA